MAPAAAKPAAPRKRNRKRKRRAVSSSSSSDSPSSSSSSSDEADLPKVSARLHPKTPVEESSDSSSSSSSDSDSDSAGGSPINPIVLPDRVIATKHFTSRSHSPSPPPVTIPSFIPPSTAAERDPTHQEQIMKDRFRKFWMASVADGFKDDLEQIRKEPNLGTSRLALLINSLASGADVFVSSHDGQRDGINEMEVVLQ